MNLSDDLPNRPVTALVYGATGSGKTSLIGEMARYQEFCPIYFMDFDLRIDALRARLSHDEMKQIYFDPYRDKNLQGESFILAQQYSNNPGLLDQKYAITFKTIVTDSGTFLMRAIMALVLRLDGGKTATTTPQLQNYMQQMSLTEEFVSKLCGSGRNFIFTCHEDASKDEVTGRLFKNVDLTGKMANRIPGYFNELWHCEVRQMTGKEPEFVVRTRPDPIYSARTSFGELQSVEGQGEVWKKISEIIKKGKEVKTNG